MNENKMNRERKMPDDKLIARVPIQFHCKPDADIKEVRANRAHSGANIRQFPGAKRGDLVANRLSA